MSELQPAPDEQLAAPPPVALQAQIRPAIVSIVTLTLLTGVGFPVALGVLARVLFPHQAGGSLISQADHVVGSELIAQRFSGPAYFHLRPSAAGDGYDGTASGGSNLGPANPQLHDAVRQRAEAYRLSNGLSSETPIPIDAVTCSASGLDPHISPANAALQVPRVARAVSARPKSARASRPTPSAVNSACSARRALRYSRSI